MSKSEDFERILSEIYQSDPEEIALSQFNFPTAEIKEEIFGEIKRGVEEISPLKEIIMAIVDGHPNTEFADRPNLKKKTQSELRAEQAYKYLTGARAPTRRKDRDDELLTSIAEDYLDEFSRQGWRPKLDTIISSRLAANGCDIDSDNRSNLISPIRTLFKAERRKLLIRVATRRYLERQFQSRQIIQVIGNLRGLGIDCDSERYDRWLEDDDYGGNQ